MELLDVSNYGKSRKNIAGGPIWNIHRNNTDNNDWIAIDVEKMESWSTANPWIATPSTKYAF